MPRIPRRSQGSEEAPPADQPTQISSGDPLAPPTSDSPAAATSEDPLAAETPDAPTDPPTEVTPATGHGQAGANAAPEPQPTVAAAPVEQPTSVLPATSDPLATAQQPTAETGEQAPTDARPRFRQRTRMRRRLRYLRRLRELAFRDLGGLVFDLHRFGRDRGDLVSAKLEALANLDRELRTLQDALDQRREFTDLREAGIAACARCGTLHDTDANYCPGCGATLRSVLVREAFPITPAGGTPAESPAPQQPTPSS